MPNRQELAEHTVAELRDLAADAEIEGRSSMNRDDLIAALADDDAPAAPAPTSAGQTAQQEAVNAGRVGLDPVLADVKAATAAREADAARPSAVTDPVRVVGADAFEAAKQATRDAEERAGARSVREAPATP